MIVAGDNGHGPPARFRLVGGVARAGLIVNW